MKQKQCTFTLIWLIRYASVKFKNPLAKKKIVSIYMQYACDITSAQNVMNWKK
jgi:hypothetical protein